MNRAPEGNGQGREQDLRAHGAEITALAEELRRSVDQALDPDQLGYAALRRGGEIHPWTEQAERIWETAPGSDKWRDHHLAILYHARAYDLEAEGSREASRYWEKALRHWARLHADDGFWDQMHRHLSEAMGHGVDAATVVAVRTGLPRKLLAPHVSLVVAYRHRDVQHARTHMALMKESAFWPSVGKQIREELFSDEVNAVPTAVRTAEFDETLATLEDCLRIDDDNPALVRALLFVHRKQNEHLYRQRRAEDIAMHVQSATRTVVDVIGPLLKPPTRHDDIAFEWACHHWWWAYSSYLAAEKQFLEAAEVGHNVSAAVQGQVARNAAAAVQHFQEAREIESSITMDSYYRFSANMEADAEHYQARYLMGYGGQPPNHARALEHFRRAATLRPNAFNDQWWLVHCLLSQPQVTVVFCTEARQALGNAERLASDAEQRRLVGELRARLDRLCPGRLHG